ncbi:MAG: choline ABC transporter substrate-binding protein [Alkalispirochaeta sp.]
MKRSIYGVCLVLMGALIFPAVGFASGAQEEQAASPTDSVEMTTVDFAEVGWLDIQATTATTRVVLEALGYDTTSTTVSVPLAYEGMSSGDLDVFLGNWMPSMATISNQYFDDGSVEQYALNLVGAKYTLAVPTYLAEAGLESFGDIADFGEELEYQIHGIEAGNDGNLLIQTMIDEDAFGLGDFQVIDSSEAGMLAEVRGRSQENEPIVFLGWEPHPMNTFLDMTYLTGGDDYFGPDLGAAEVYTNIRTGFDEEYPNLGQFFENLEFTLTMENEIMTAINDGADAREAAADWLRTNPEVLEAWLDGVLAVDGESGLATVESALEI